MEISLILYLVAFIAVVYLIFKFIKKLVFAVFTLILLVVLVVGGIGGLVFMDFKQLSTQNDFDINFILEKNGEYNLGINVPVRNQQLAQDKVSGISSKDLKLIDVEKLNKEDNKFVFVVDNELFKELIKGQTLSLDGLNLGTELDKLDFSLTEKEVLTLMNSNSVNDLVDLILEKNNAPFIEVLRPIAINKVNEAFTKYNLELNQILFLYSLKSSLDDKQNILKLLNSYKNQEQFNVYPDRFSFKLVRMLPVDTIMSYVPTNIEAPTIN